VGLQECSTACSVSCNEGCRWTPTPHLLGQGASLLRLVEDLVVEDGEVQGKAQADWVGGRQLRHGLVLSGLVGLERLVRGALAVVLHLATTWGARVEVLAQGERQGK